MYPLKLHGVEKEKIWGGDDLKYFHKDQDIKTLGEIWELACHPNGESSIENGPLKGKGVCTLLEDSFKDWLGNTYERFPLLVKLLDAKSDLSLQVHPNDQYAIKHYNSMGKTECWYILDAEPGAEIILGTNSCSLEETMQDIESENLTKCLNHIEVKPGEFYMVPAGTVHGIGKGVVILEIQENSDLTFRLHDFGRGRKLHIEEAKNVIDTEADFGKCRGFKENVEDNEVIHFVENEHFEVAKVSIRNVYNNKPDGRFQLISCIGGSGYLTYNGEIFDMKTGDQFFIPAQMSEYAIRGMVDVIITKPGSIKH